MKINHRYLLAIIVVMSFVILKQYKNNKRQERLFTELVGTETEFKKLKNENAQLAIKYRTQVEITQETLNEFHEVTGHLKERIKVLSDATFAIAEKARENNQSDIKYVTKKGESFLLNELRFNDGPAIGYVLIFQDGRMVSKIYDHEINVDQVVSKDEGNGKYKILTHADYILKSPSLNKDWYNKPYRLKIKNAEAFVDPTEPNYTTKSRFMWNPRLNMNLILDPKPKAGLGVSLAGYGKSPNDLSLKFMDIGLVYDSANETVQPTLMPLLFRPLPQYLPNTYFGPGVIVEGLNGFKYFGGLQVGF